MITPQNNPQKLTETAPETSEPNSLEMPQPLNEALIPLESREKMGPPQPPEVANSQYLERPKTEEKPPVTEEPAKTAQVNQNPLQEFIPPKRYEEMYLASVKNDDLYEEDKQAKKRRYYDFQNEVLKVGVTSDSNEDMPE